MDYPIEILPNINYKSIDCDLSNHYLIRYTSVKEYDKIWNSQMNQIYVDQICSLRDNIQDLSTSLLGVYNFRHVFIELLPAGSEYLQYCEPFQEVNAPVFDYDFTFNFGKHFWHIKISDIDDKTFIIDRSGTKLSITSYVSHTPMRWNFWHFSVRWRSGAQEVSDLGEKEKKVISQKVGHVARANFAQFIKVNTFFYNPLDELEYKTNNRP